MQFLGRPRFHRDDKICRLQQNKDAWLPPDDSCRGPCTNRPGTGRLSGYDLSSNPAFGWDRQGNFEHFVFISNHTPTICSLWVACQAIKKMLREQGVLCWKRLLEIEQVTAVGALPTTSVALKEKLIV